MSLKGKLVCAVTLLVLAVVLAVTLASLAAAVALQVRQVEAHADFLAHGVYYQAGQELAAAVRAGRIDPRRPAATLQAFFRGLGTSPAMAALFNSDVGYASPEAIRDVALVDTDGIVVGGSNPIEVGQPRAAAPGLANLEARGGLRELQALFGPGHLYEYSLTVVAQLPAGQYPLGSIRVAVDGALLRAALIPLIHNLFWWGLAIVLFSAALAALLSGLLLRPLGGLSAQLDRLMAEAARAASAGAPPLDWRQLEDAPATPPPPPGLLARRDEFGVVAGKIERLGRKAEDARQVYSALQESVAQVLERLDDGLLLFDADGVCLLASAAAPRLLGCRPGGLAGRPAAALLARADGLAPAVAAALAAQAPLAPREFARPDAPPLLARLDLVPERLGRPAFLLMLRDAEPVRRLEDELELARRLSAVGRLTRGIAHEVKNPLNAISIHLELLRQKAGRGAAAVHPHLEVIRREIERLDRVVKTFLDFSRPVDLRLALTDLAALVRGVNLLVAAGAEAQGIALQIAAPDSGPQVWVDRDLMEQVLLNLVNNGLQAIAAQPAVPGAPRALRLEVLDDDAAPGVRVRDSGPGVPDDIREKIFDLYFTTRGEGTGIGLAVATRIMQLHNGRLELEPADGGGASFVLRFPLASRRLRVAS